MTKVLSGLRCSSGGSKVIHSSDYDEGLVRGQAAVLVEVK